MLVLVGCLFVCVVVFLPTITSVGLGSGGSDNNRGLPAEGSCSAVLLVLELLLASMVTGSWLGVCYTQIRGLSESSQDPFACRECFL